MNKETEIWTLPPGEYSWPDNTAIVYITIPVLLGIPKQSCLSLFSFEIR